MESLKRGKSMARYISPESRARKQKEQRRRKMIMYSVMALFVVAAAFLIVKVAERFIRPGEKDGMMQKPNTDVSMQRDSYNDFEGTVQPTINLEPATPEMTMIQVPESDKVDISYFSDAVFMGDSLARLAPIIVYSIYYFSGKWKTGRKVID